MTDYTALLLLNNILYTSKHYYFKVIPQLNKIRTVEKRSVPSEPKVKHSSEMIDTPSVLLNFVVTFDVQVTY